MAEIVMTTECLLELIFRHLTFSDLKTCRQVNKKWTPEASKQLIRKYSTRKIELYYSKNFSCAIIFKDSDLNENEIRIKQKIKNFVTLVENSKKLSLSVFPCASLKLSARHLKNEKVQVIVQVLGQFIKELECDGTSASIQDFKHFQRLLEKQVTNLHSLQICFIPPSWKGPDVTSTFLSSKKRSPQVFYYLHTLIFDWVSEDSITILGKILQKAINLKNIRVKEIETRAEYSFYELVIQYEKAKYLKSFLTQSYLVPLGLSEAILDQWEVIADTKPELDEMDTGIVFHRNYPPKFLSRQASIFSSLINSSSSTLQAIKRSIDFLLSLPGFRFPILPKIAEISCFNLHFNHIDFLEGTAPVFLPMQNAGFNETFPNLETLKIDYFLNIDEGLQEDRIITIETESLVPLESVTTFIFTSSDYSRAIPPHHCEYFGKKFPNLKFAELTTFYEFLGAARHIWKEFPNLVQLTVGLEVSNKNFFPSVDQAFTGFTSETCVRLRDTTAIALDDSDESFEQYGDSDESFDQYDGSGESFELYDASTDIEELRVNPSILDLKNLKSLKIKVNAPLSQEWNSIAVLTRVTGIYAFAMCPHLTITLSIHAQPFEDPNCLLQEWIPVVDVCPYVHRMVVNRNPYFAY